MRGVDIIAKKRDGLALTAEEIDFFIQAYTRGDIPDYQASAWAMAVLLRGMSSRETIDLTMSMVRSGRVLDMSSVAPSVVDKHSTGGVGDKTTLVVAPLVASAGLPIAKMSGRGLGFTGGTLDKLESIPGFRVSLSMDEFLATVRDVGIAVVSQTSDLVPADRKLYALRDVTATVPSLPLIASSIMSKKIAGGATAVVLDVKVGRGSFMPTLQDAEALARIMIDIGKGVGLQVSAVLSEMGQPLGRAVGNAVEVAEAVQTLRGAGPPDLLEHCLIVAEEMLVLGSAAETRQAARTLLVDRLATGAACDAFVRWIEGQGGDGSVVDNLSLLPTAPIVRDVTTDKSAYVSGIDAREVGLVAMTLGAGRTRKGQDIDPAVGIVLGPKVGGYHESGETLLTIHARTDEAAMRAEERLLLAYTWSSTPPKALPVIHKVINSG